MEGWRDAQHSSNKMGESYSHRSICRAVGAHRNFSRKGQGLGDMAIECGAWAYNAGLGHSPSGVQCRAPGQTVSGRRPLGLKLKSFEAFVRLREGPKLCCQYVKTDESEQQSQADASHIFSLHGGASAPSCRCLWAPICAVLKTGQAMRQVI